MIYSVFVFTNTGYPITSRIASRLVGEPSLILEALKIDIKSIKKRISVKLENFVIDVVPAENLIYVVVHSDDPSIAKFEKELKIAKPDNYRALVKLLRSYVAPKRSDIEKLIKTFHEATKDLEELKIEKEERKQFEPDQKGLSKFLEAYLEGNYLEAARYDPRSFGETAKVKTATHIVHKILRLFSARMTYYTNTPEVPDRSLMLKVLDEIIKANHPAARYYEALLNLFPRVNDFVRFTHMVLSNADHLIETLSLRKNLLTTLAVPAPGITNIFSKVVTSVPEVRRDLFYPRIGAAMIAEGRPHRHVIIRSVEKIMNRGPFYYTYYLPLAIATSAALTRGGNYVFIDELYEHAKSIDQERYTLYETSTLGRSIPILASKHSNFDKLYDKIVENVASRYSFGAAPHVYYAMVASVIALAGLMLDREEGLVLLRSMEVYESIRHLYRLSIAGSRGAYLALARILPTLALAASKRLDDKRVSEMILRTHIMIPSHDYMKFAVIEAAEKIGKEDIAEILKKSYGPQ